MLCFRSSLLALSLTLSAVIAGCSNHPKNTVRYDDGQQMNSPFRLNYAGYLPLQSKVAVFISPNQQAIDWQVIQGKNKVVLQGVTEDYRADDFASGDSFYRIDFSALTTPGNNYRLRINGQESVFFSISDDPYGDLKYEFFDYFKDHERRGDHFNRAVNNWTDHSVTLDFVADAGDQGYYPVNAAEAQWALINLLETYPNVNEYYQQAGDYNQVYSQLAFMSRPMDKIIFPGQKLAAAKFATFTNTTYAVCPGAPGNSGPCISKPETKATFSIARTLAAMARLHQNYGNTAIRDHHYQYAKMALHNAQQTPFVCITHKDVGGEGGYYPNNDNWSLWRDPRSHRDPCADGPIADPKDNNINDDHYAALVELYLAALTLGHTTDAQQLKTQIEAHSHHLRIDSFFFGAVSPEATLSLLTHQPKDMDLSAAHQDLTTFANTILRNQQVGYPGVTLDVQANIWDAKDNDDKDNNFRWASNRMQLNDARILMVAADISYAQGAYQQAADYTNGVLRVLDQISGTNAVALAMYTAEHYPHIEHAVTRTHDALVSDSEDGKLALGPNNWTNSNDPEMPKFGSLPGMKMFTLTGTGWASREIAIDGNAALVPVVYFATEVAGKYLRAAHNHQHRQ